MGICWPKKAYMDYGRPKLAKRGIGKTYIDLGRPRYTLGGPKGA